MDRVAERCAREGISFRQAASDEGISLTSIEAENMERRKAYQEILWNARHRYAQELANNPQATKSSAIGMMMQAIQKLLEHGDWDKAIAGIEKLSKLQGWVGADTNVNLIAGISTKDLEKIKAKLQDGHNESTGITGTA